MKEEEVRRSSTRRSIRRRGISTSNAARPRGRRRDARVDREHAADDGRAASGRPARRGRAQEGGARDARPYLKKPAPDLLLLLVSPAGAKPTRLSSTRVAAIEFKPLSGARIPKWIAYYVEHDLKASITEGAVTLLQEAAGTELAQLKIELDKLVAFTGGEAIDEAAVSAVVGVRPGETLGDLLDAVANRDATAALAMVPAVLQQPKSGGVPIVLALTVQTLGIGWAQAARERGASPSRLNGDLFNLLKETGALSVARVGRVRIDVRRERPTSGARATSTKRWRRCSMPT